MRNFLILFALLPLGTAVSKPLFDSDEPLQAVLTAPITQIYRERKQDVRLYHAGTLAYKLSDDQTQRLNLKVRTRGNFRRANCANPPLMLNFPKKANDGNLFEGQDKLKLVGPCKQASAYQNYLGLEYLTYKMWELISPYHFRTRLIEMNYIDSDGKRKPWQFTTFVIEDVKDMAKRLGLKRLEQPKVKRDNMDLQQTALLEMFQLMIGNTDYSTLAAPDGDDCCHNARLLVNAGSSTGAIPVPYDFDVTGFVDPPYGTPASQYPIKNVRQRYFTGWCKEDRRFNAAIEVFKREKQRLYDLVLESPLIDDASRKKATRYLDSYFQIINDPERVEREIIGRCRGSVIRG
jgi:hypothetical protein